MKYNTMFLKQSITHISKGVFLQSYTDIVSKARRCDEYVKSK